MKYLLNLRSDSSGYEILKGGNKDMLMIIKPFQDIRAL